MARTIRVRVDQVRVKGLSAPDAEWFRRVVEGEVRAAAEAAVSGGEYQSKSGGPGERAASGAARKIAARVAAATEGKP